MSLKGIEDILEADLKALKNVHQVSLKFYFFCIFLIIFTRLFDLKPMLVNDQLNQLYIEMELEGLSAKLTLEEGITSSSSSGEETISHVPKVS